MNTIAFGIVGIIILLGAAFFSTYYGSLDSTKNHGPIKFRRTLRRINHKPEREQGTTSAMHGGKEVLPLMRKQTKYHLAIFAFLLGRHAKHNKKGAPQFDL